VHCDMEYGLFWMMGYISCLDMGGCLVVEGLVCIDTIREERL
jgi:hypothetical protein